MTHRPNQAQTITYSETYGYVKLLLGSTHSRFKNASYHVDAPYAEKLELPLFDGYLRKSGKVLACIVTLDVDNPEAAEALRLAAIEYKAKNGLLPIFLTTSASGLPKVHCGFGIARGEVSEDGSRFKVDPNNGEFVDFSEFARMLAYEIGFPEEHLDFRGTCRCFCTPSFLSAMENVTFVSPDLVRSMREGWRSISKSRQALVAAAQTSDFQQPAISLQAEALSESLTAMLAGVSIVEGLTLKQTQLLWLMQHMQTKEKGHWLSHKLVCATLDVGVSHYYQMIEMLQKKGFITCLDPNYIRGKKSRRWTVINNPWASQEGLPTDSHSNEVSSPVMNYGASAQSYIDSNASGYSSGNFNELEYKACVFAVHRGIGLDEVLAALMTIPEWGLPRRVRRLYGSYKWAQRKIQKK